VDLMSFYLCNRYLPPYTTFLPVREHENDVKRNEKSVVECLVFSQLSYLVIFIILICITESNSLKEDPLNFNVLNITLEVIRQVTLSFLSFSNIFNLSFSYNFTFFAWYTHNMWSYKINFIIEEKICYGFESFTTPTNILIKLIINIYE